MTQDKMQSSEKNIESVEIQDSGSLHHYRTEIPNIIFQMKLDPWAFKAYCLFKMTAGDRGVCFKSNITLSEEIGCSVPTLIKLKHQLEKEGLIKIIKRVHENGGNLPDLIQIVDIWPQNMQIMSNFYPANPKNDLKNWKKNDSNNSYGSKPNLSGGVKAVNEGSKRRLHKQEPKEQELNKTTTKPPPKKSIEKPKPKSGGGFFNCLKETKISQPDKIRLSSIYAEEIVCKVLAYIKRPGFKLKTSLDRAIFHYCKNPDQMQPNAEEIFRQKQKQKDLEDEKFERRKGLCKILMKEAHKKKWHTVMNNESFEIGDYEGHLKKAIWIKSSDFLKEIEKIAIEFGLDTKIPKDI